MRERSIYLQKEYPRQYRADSRAGFTRETECGGIVFHAGLVRSEKGGLPLCRVTQT